MIQQRLIIIGELKWGSLFNQKKMTEMNNVLVTGGLGFIGSNFIRFVLNLNQDFKIINVDKLTYAGNPENLYYNK